MHKLIIKHVGPLSQCEISINKFTVLTGPQAVGKSTVAKAIFFFRTVKNDILNLMSKREAYSNDKSSLKNEIIKHLRAKFLQMFGSSHAMLEDMRMEYYYTSDVFIKIKLNSKKMENYTSYNYIWFDLSSSVQWFLEAAEKENFDYKKAEERLVDLFADGLETIFIPAGRSLITTLTSQLNYIFTIMDDMQRRTIDYSMQTYIERIFKIKNAFSNGVEDLYWNCLNTNTVNKKIYKDKIEEAIKLSKSVLKGSYKFTDNEERLFLEDGKYVKINFASSGQQEAIWIFNLIIYYMLNNPKLFVILEEPEAHLYPDAQKKIAELTALAAGMPEGNVLITTHSPYILGTINNLLYAARLTENYKEQVWKIIDKNKLIFEKDMKAFFVSGGTVKSCVDEELGLIQNEVIDGASEKINSEYDALMSLEYSEEEKA